MSYCKVVQRNFGQRRDSSIFMETKAKLQADLNQVLGHERGTSASARYYLGIKLWKKACTESGFKLKT